MIAITAGALLMIDITDAKIANIPTKLFIVTHDIKLKPHTINKSHLLPVLKFCILFLQLGGKNNHMFYVLLRMGYNY